MAKTKRARSTDPRKRGVKPPLPKKTQRPPGSEAEMRPEPDYGLESYRGSGRLEGKVAVITGGDSGIGRAVALAFARECADVVISYLSEHEDAQVTEAVVTDAGRRALLVPGDIGEERNCIDLIRQSIYKFGRLDILVNNAAIQKTYDSIVDIPAGEIEHVFRTNVFSMFYLCKAALPRMKPGSVIINTASIQAYQPSPSLLPYAATKGAVVNFTKALAKQAMEKFGVRVNAVAPGPVWTPLIPSSFSGERLAKFGEDTPVGRPAQPAELAPAYVFLASQESSYVVGEVVGVTGGELLP